MITNNFNMAKFSAYSNDELVKSAIAGDKLALCELLSRNETKIFSCFCALRANQNELQDLCQEVLLKVSKNIKKLNNPKYFNAWLNKIIIRQFYDSLRKKKNAPSLFEIDDDKNRNFKLEIKDCAPSPYELAMYHELSHKIRKSISTLPREFKNVIILREILGLSYDEISRLTNVNKGTVKSRISRAREKVQGLLEGYCKGA